MHVILVALEIQLSTLYLSDDGMYLLYSSTQTGFDTRFFRWNITDSLVNGPRDRSSILGRVIPKTQKMVLDASLFNTWHYKVEI